MTNSHHTLKPWNYSDGTRQYPIIAALAILLSSASGIAKALRLRALKLKQNNSRCRGSPGANDKHCGAD
jgi:hypothetical protein